MLLITGKDQIEIDSCVLDDYDFIFIT